MGNTSRVGALRQQAPVRGAFVNVTDHDKPSQNAAVVHRRGARLELPGQSGLFFWWLQVDGDVVVAKMLERRAYFGYDAARSTYVGLVEAGVIDPTKVVRVVLENAVSVAGILLLTEATMTELPERKMETAADPELSV